MNTILCAYYQLRKYQIECGLTTQETKRRLNISFLMAMKIFIEILSSDKAVEPDGTKLH